jgi:hypothetical protein
MTDDRDRFIEALLRQKRQDDDLTTTERCVDAEVLAAWVDGSLSAQALADAERHAAGCARCQALLASMARTMPEVDTRPWWRSVTVKWLVPVAAVATGLVVWVSVERRPEEVVARPIPEAAGPVATTPAAPPSAAPTEVEQNAQRILDARAKASANELKKEISAQPGESAASKNTRAESKPAASPVDAVTLSRDALMAPTQAPARREAAETARQDSPKGPPRPVSPPQAGAAAAAPAPQLRTPATPSGVAETVTIQSESTDKLAVAGRGGVGGGISAFSAAPEIRSPQSDSRWRIVPPSGIQRSVDGGVTWAVVDPVPVQPVAGAASATVLTTGASPSRDVCWIVGRAGMVLVTTDGATWQRRPIPEAVDLIAVRAIDARTATVTTADGRQFATADGGITWTPIRRAPDLGQE